LSQILCSVLYRSLLRRDDKQSDELKAHEQNSKLTKELKLVMPKNEASALRMLNRVTFNWSVRRNRRCYKEL